jgi:predicted ATP-grasp superfamily ATP-dependent carboligase
LRVPAWDEILLFAAQSYDAIPLGYFGIDIVIDAKLGPSILELNARPGLSIQLATRRGLRRILQELKARDTEKLAAKDRVEVGLEVVMRDA